MARWIGACMVLALLAGCESTARTPGELIRQQAEQEAQAAPATPVALPPPEFLMPRAASDPALAERTLEEAEQRIAPARPGETAQPVTEDADAEWLAKVRAHASQREFDQAVQLMLAEARRDPARPQLWRELARLFDGLGRRDTALNAWSQLRSLAPMDLEAIASSGLDCLALRKFLPAAEHLLLARRLLLTAPPDEARQRMQVACAAGLGLALGELGYAMAAAACFHDAAQLERALLQSPSADERSLPRQGREFERFAGEMEASAGHWSEASRSFAEALSRSEATSAVALPPLVWSLACSGRPAEARRCVMEALAQPDRPGRAGAPAAVQWLQRHGLASPLEVALTERAGADASTQDALVLRCLVALGREEAAQRVVDLESDARICGDEIALGEAARLLAAKRGVDAVAAMAATAVQDEPRLAARWAAALRSLPARAVAVRDAIQRTPVRDETRGVLAANFDLAGYDSLRALHAAEPFVERRDALGSAARIAALKALATEQDLAKITRVAQACDAASSEEAAALSEAFLACGEMDAAVRHAERAIELNRNAAAAWIARAAIDLALATDPGAERSLAQRRESALEARGALERATQAAPDDRMAARRYLEVAAPERAMAPDDDALDIVRSAKASCVQREARREKALTQARRGQAEASLEALRLLLQEDPQDVIVGQALVAAAGEAGRLDETGSFLRALCPRHPAEAALSEADLAVRARQGRLPEALDLLLAAFAEDPESDALLRACVRTLTAAGRTPEAVAVMERAPSRVRMAAGRTQLERIEFKLTNAPDSAAQELRGLAAGGTLSRSQRQQALAMARRLPREIDDRAATLAALATPLLADASIMPVPLAMAMLVDASDAACSLAARHARAWSVPTTIEAAQLLVDEAKVDRAECLLREAVRASQGRNRSLLFRAELAAIIARGDAERAQLRLAEERSEHGFRLKDPAETSEAEDLAELGNAFLLACQTRAAEACFQDALRRAPDLSSAMNNLAWLRMERNQLDPETSDLVKRAMAAAPGDPSTLDTAGWLAYRQGRLEDHGDDVGGLSLLRRSLELSKDRASPESIDHYADALYRAGKADEAQKLWRLVAEQGAGRSSRSTVVSAFDLLQRKERGIRAWSADAFYDRNDGAAIERAKRKLQAVAEGRAPEVAPMDAAAAPDATPHDGSAPTHDGASAPPNGSSPTPSDATSPPQGEH